MNKIFVTFFGVGLIKPAPGTWGSAAALPVGYALHVLGGPVLFISMTILLCFLGGYAIQQYTMTGDDHDPSEVVIDEVVGQWIALWPLSVGMWYAGVAATSFPYPGWITAFILFRIFDITKPSLVGWADRKQGAVGVMLDDVIAGAFAGCGVMFLAAIFHWAAL